MAENKDADIFKELNAQIKSAEGKMPDSVTIGGQVFRREGAPVIKGPVRKKWRNPRTGLETDEDVESVTINVAPHADRITLDGVIYFANRTYDFPKRIADTVRDIISQTWRHEQQTGGANSFNAGPVRNQARAGGGVGFAA